MKTMRRRIRRVKASKRPTRDDVAKLAGTSGSTVSRVFNPRSDIPVAEETRERILRAARQIGYLPNPNARALTNGRTGVIGFWICLEYSHYRAQVLDAMRTALGGSRMAMQVANVDEEYWRDLNFSRTFRTSVDGILAFDSSVSLFAFENSQTGSPPRTPFVSMGAIWSEDLSYVGIDLGAGTEEAIAHLMDTGRRKIALMVPAAWQLHASGPRFETYRSVMEMQGMALDLILTEGADLVSVSRALEDRIATTGMPEALLCINDDVAISACRVLPKLGFRVGWDVAVVGCDGIRETAEEPCPITTIQQPIDLMCARALEYLFAQIENPRAEPQRCVLKPNLVIRESTALGSKTS